MYVHFCVCTCARLSDCLCLWLTVCMCVFKVQRGQHTASDGSGVPRGQVFAANAPKRIKKRKKTRRGISGMA